ncbi:MAG: HipA domain-containing protein [Clostridia bacterium]|nr:HipA domain-containing protein [Clostridia bacterium]
MSEVKETMFIKSKYSLEDLEQFRDENGFIDLSKAGIQLTAESREKKGTAERIKNWVDFNGKKVLIRGNAVENFSMYAELIIEELAKQAGIPVAHYDIVKILGEDGTYTYGVLSEAMLDLEREDLLTLHDLIGDEPKVEYTTEEEFLESLEYEETVKYDFTIERLTKRLEDAGYSQEEIEHIIREYQKRLVFALKVIDGDKHPENIAFIQREDGKLELSPCFDNEFSLLLERDPEILQFFLEMGEIGEECDTVSPKIGTFVSKSDGGLGSMWRDTLEILCEDDEVYDFYESLRETLDIEAAFRVVEERIHAKLPDLVKGVAKKAYEERGKEMAIVMGDEEIMMDQSEKHEPGFDFLLSILNKGKTEGVRTAEQVRLRTTDGSRFKSNQK